MIAVLLGVDSLLEAAQARAIAWLQAHRHAWVDTYTVGLAVWLDRRYGWGLKLPWRRYVRAARGEVRFFVGYPITSPPRLAGPAWEALQPPLQQYVRLLWASETGQLDTGDLALVRAWWADKKGYGITHAYLVAWRLLERGLAHPLLEEVVRYAPLYFCRVRSQDLCLDVTWEHLAMWAESQQYRDLLRERLLEGLHHQRPDGGFPGTCEEGAPSHLHTTLLAAWALSAYLHAGS